MADDGDTSGSSELGLQASWLLFDGYARKFQQEQARQSENASAADKLNSQRLLIASVADAFFNAQLAKASVAIAAADQDFYEKQLADAEHRRDAGTGSEGDVLNIKVQLNAAKNSLIVSQRDYEAAKYGLAALLGLDSVLPAADLAPLERECSPSGLGEEHEALIKEALAGRPDLKGMEMQIKAAEAAVGLAEAEDWPKVQLAGQAGSRSQSDLAPEEDDLGASLTLSLSYTLYSGGAVEAAQAEARQAKREVSHSLTNLRNSIAAEVRQNVTQLAAAREQVRLQEESVKLVEENRKLAESEYEAGASTLIRLNEAQRDLTATQGRQAQALVGCQQARHRLLAAVGKNLEPFAALLTAGPQEENK
jgi:outer membrane protein TolC